MFCVGVRYNGRIKTYMRDVNAVKKASADTSRVSTHFRRAVELFWPGKVAKMTSLLLQDDSMSATLKSHSKFEEIFSFRRLVTGAVSEDLTQFKCRQKVNMPTACMFTSFVNTGNTFRFRLRHWVQLAFFSA